MQVFTTFLFLGAPCHSDFNKKDLYQNQAKKTIQKKDPMGKQYTSSWAVEITEGGDNMADEMADILWVLICLANQTGTDLTSALENNFKKKDLRDNLRHKDNPKLK